MVMAMDRKTKNSICSPVCFAKKTGILVAALLIMSLTLTSLAVSPVSCAKKEKTAKAPGRVTGLNVEAIEGERQYNATGSYVLFGLKVSWKKVKNATGYEVTYQKGTNGKPTVALHKYTDG